MMSYHHEKNQCVPYVSFSDLLLIVNQLVIHHPEKKKKTQITPLHNTPDFLVGKLDFVRGNNNACKTSLKSILHFLIRDVKVLLMQCVIGAEYLM